MCGIMGYYSFGSKLPDKNQIANMFSLLESRGKDASGFAYLYNKNLIVKKGAIKSSDLIKTKDWLDLSLPRFMIFHTRLKTQGSEKNNSNNHPLFTKTGIAVVHNGVILNDKEIFGNRQRDGEVDSESILVLLSTKFKGDRIRKLFNNIYGSFAIAFIDKNYPDKLFLIKKDNPIDIYYNPKDDILYFCSERSIMQEALKIKRNFARGFNLNELDYYYFQMDNNHALIINKNGVESYTKYFPTKRYYNRDEIISPNYNTYNEILISCPHCLGTTAYYYEKMYNHCIHCGCELNEEDMYNNVL